MKKGRPKGEHKTVISARLSDEAMNYLKKAYNYYGVNKSTFIDNSIKYFYLKFSEKYIQKYIKEEETK